MKRKKPVVLSNEEIDTLIDKIKTVEIPKLTNKRVPSNCKMCRLGKYCRVIKHTLICPWLKQLEENKTYADTFSTK